MRRLWHAVTRFLHRAERRRRGVRLHIDEGLYLTIGDRVVVGIARDLSAGGVFFETEAKLPVGAPGTLTRSLTSGDVSVRVVRSTARGAGMVFRSDE